MTPSAPRWLYLHGFASGPESFKAKALAAHYGRRAIVLERLDLRLPSLEHLRLSSIMAHVRDRIGGPRDRAVLIGSSLGGLTACRVAEDDARVCALVLLAPAFRLAEGWRRRLGEEGCSAWRSSGWLETHDYRTGKPGRVDFGFLEDVERIDGRGDGWPDVRVPTLIVHGKRDETVGVERSLAFAKGRRHVRLIEVDDGHDLAASMGRIEAEADAFLRGFLGDESP